MFEITKRERDIVDNFGACIKTLTKYWEMKQGTPKLFYFEQTTNRETVAQELIDYAANDSSLF